MNKITRTFLLDNLKNVVTIIYFIMIALLSWSTLALEANEAKSTMTVMNILLFIVPLMALLYSSIYIYNSREFLILLLCQPLKRSRIWDSLFCGVTGSLVVAFFLGSGIPILIYHPDIVGITLVLSGIAITLIFSAIAFFTTIITTDKTKGVGVAILIWLLFTIVYDGLCLFLLFSLSDYPINNVIMGILMINPLDITRFLSVISLEQDAMMGFSGAAFKAFFGQSLGIAISAILLLLWIALPYYFSRRIFNKKDL